MKNNQTEKQPQPTEAIKDKSPTPYDFSEEGFSEMPPELEDTRRVTRQNRFVTYFVDKTQESNEPSILDKAREEASRAMPSAEDMDIKNTAVKEVDVDKDEDNNKALEGKTSTPRNVRCNPEKYNAEDKALRNFADILIGHLETIDVGDWTRPWIFGRDMKWPHNLDGREYSGGNALMLLMHTQQKGFTAPVYATFERYKRLNFEDGDKDKPITDAEGKPLPKVSVQSGAKHIPVVKTVYNAVHKETKERIPFADYLKLSKSEQKEYNIYPRNFVYQVFNIDQTNLKEARPELYEQLTKGTGKVFSEIRRDEDMCFPAIDAMIMKNLWQCPIVVQYSQQAYYSPQSDRIVLPEKQQFKYPESFYGTLFHECAHSTGAKHRYERDLGQNDRKQYAREELVAELTAALVASRYGLMKHVKSDSLPYLKSWLNDLKEKPEFIKQLLTDVRKASSQIIRRVDLIQNRIEELRNMGVPEPEYYPDFLEVNPITNQPVDDPVRYLANDEEQETDIMEKQSFGRGRR